MIVEVFYKGTFFKKPFDTFWNIKKIVRSGSNFCLVPEEDSPDEAVVLNTDEYELRVHY